MDKNYILKLIKENQTISQRHLSHLSNYSLGKVNSLVRILMDENLIVHNGESYQLTPNGNLLLESFKVDNAIILAAGFGSRFVPLTYETPKGLLEVHGEKMIERQIVQLHENSISDITIVVGYLKEKFEYLIEKYNVKLIFNPCFTSKNNLYSLYLVRDLLKNTYILSADNYMTENIFSTYETHSWYSAIFSEKETDEWCLSFNKNNLITGVTIGGTHQWHMYGPSFFHKTFSDTFKDLLLQYSNKPEYSHCYWEHILIDNLKVLPIHIKRFCSNVVKEFESLEELRNYDCSYMTDSKNDYLALIGSAFNVAESSIINIKPLKLGMTNNSFTFEVNKKTYIFRVPGEGTSMLIDRCSEKLNYDTISNTHFSDEIVYLNASTGVKISVFIPNVRLADFKSGEDLSVCCEFLNKLHDCNLEVPHTFNIKKSIELYEDLCKSSDSLLFNDYSDIKLIINQLLQNLDHIKTPTTFCHIDPNCDNFLFVEDGTLKLIDWEYSAMCDPLMDIAMMGIYSYFNKDDLERLLNEYLKHNPTHEERIRFFSYVALGGFLWSLWAQYKQGLGVSFGDYAMKMFRYAKDYSNLVLTIIEKGSANEK